MGLFWRKISLENCITYVSCFEQKLIIINDRCTNPHCCRNRRHETKADVAFRSHICCTTTCYWKHVAFLLLSISIRLQTVLLLCDEKIIASFHIHCTSISYILYQDTYQPAGASRYQYHTVQRRRGKKRKLHGVFCLQQLTSIMNEKRPPEIHTNS